jgi:hypothetical protein
VGHGHRSATAELIVRLLGSGVDARPFLCVAIPASTNVLHGLCFHSGLGASAQWLRWVNESLI